MNENNNGGIWVFAEHRGGELHEVSLELLGKARELADQANKEVTAVLLGCNISSLSRTLINYGADSVLVADDARLVNYRLIPFSLIAEGKKV